MVVPYSPHQLPHRANLLRVARDGRHRQIDAVLRADGAFVLEQYEVDHLDFDPVVKEWFCTVPAEHHVLLRTALSVPPGVDVIDHLVASFSGESAESLEDRLRASLPVEVTVAS